MADDRPFLETAPAQGIALPGSFPFRWVEPRVLAGEEGQLSPLPDQWNRQFPQPTVAVGAGRGIPEAATFRHRCRFPMAVVVDTWATRMPEHRVKLDVGASLCERASPGNSGKNLYSDPPAAPPALKHRRALSGRVCHTTARPVLQWNQPLSREGTGALSRGGAVPPAVAEPCRPTCRGRAR